LYYPANLIEMGNAGTSGEVIMDLMNHQQSEREVNRAQASREELIERIAQAIREDGTVEPLEGLMLRRASSPTELGHGVSYPALCVIAQGTKEILLGDSLYRYDSAHYLITTAALPITSRITEASEERPYLGLVLRLDPTLVGSVMVEASHPAPRGHAAVRAIDVSPLDAGLLDAVVRLVRLLDSPTDARHGGTVIFVPTEDAGEPSREHPYVDLRYPFAEARARLSFPDLIVDILDRLAQLYGTADHEQEPGAVGWEEFEETTDAEIETLDEALFETAHLIAGLAAADGAVVMSKQNELLGFGGMISGRLPDVERVWRALDLEGKEVAEERTGNVGSRHRSAYRLASALPGSVAVVVSQDGGVRFVCQRGGRVTYWEQE
jgi:AraC-type transcriptional regulator N-terminus